MITVTAPRRYHAAAGAQELVKEMRNGGKPAEVDKASGGYI